MRKDPKQSLECRVGRIAFLLGLVRDLWTGTEGSFSMRLLWTLKLRFLITEMVSTLENIKTRQDLKEHMHLPCWHNPFQKVIPYSIPLSGNELVPQSWNLALSLSSRPAYSLVFLFYWCTWRSFSCPRYPLPRSIARGS